MQIEVGHRIAVFVGFVVFVPDRARAFEFRGVLAETVFPRDREQLLQRFPQFA